MHKKIVLALFIVVIAAIAIIFLQQKYKKAPGEEKITASRIVIPQVEHSPAEDDISSYSAPEKNSLVPLNSDETLLATVDMDFDGDGQDDQINAIRASGNPFISLIVGLFSPQKGEYERVATIATPIRQLSSFSYTGLDLTGEHRTALVYQGVVDTGKSILQAFFISRTETGVAVTQIANLEGDNTIYVEQTERSDAYLMTASTAPSFSIWVYSTNPETKAEIEEKYDWDSEKMQYVMTDQPTEITSASHTNQRQGASNTDYLSILDGLWYKIDASKGDMHYLYVDKSLKQFLFLEEDQYELYEWVRSTPRSNGIYITAKNDEITNFQRQIDISFNGPDQFKLRVVDFLFIVSDGGAWNGEYKKMTDATSYLKSIHEKNYKYKSFMEKLEEGKWTTPDGTVLTFGNGIYTAESENFVDTGVYTALDDSSKPFIQFRSSTETPLFKKTYLMTRPEKQKETILLQPYALSPDQSYAVDDHVIILEPYSEEE